MDDLLKSNVPPHTNVLLFSDSEYTLKAVQGQQKIRKNAKLIRKVKQLINRANQKLTTKIRFQWIAGHAGIVGNEIADKLATLGKKKSARGALK